MWLKKTAISIFVGCLIFSVQAQCIVITPSNVVLPASAGEIFSFDFVVFDAMDTNALAFQATISVSGPGILTLDELNSEAVATISDYWAFGNSAVASAFVQDGNSVFGDYTADGLGEPLYNNDIMARYAFIWDGTEGDYTFTLDLDISKSFVQNGVFETEVLGFTPGSYQGDNNNFTINIPEPCTLIIFALGTTGVLLKKRVT
jgi:hypothetical protein